MVPVLTLFATFVKVCHRSCGFVLGVLLPSGRWLVQLHSLDKNKAESQPIWSLCHLVHLFRINNKCFFYMVASWSCTFSCEHDRFTMQILVSYTMPGAVWCSFSINNSFKKDSSDSGGIVFILPFPFAGFSVSKVSGSNGAATSTVADAEDARGWHASHRLDWA